MRRLFPGLRWWLRALYAYPYLLECLCFSFFPCNVPNDLFLLSASLVARLGASFGCTGGSVSLRRIYSVYFRGLPLWGFGFWC